jgi:hypothetical protein
MLATMLLQAHEIHIIYFETHYNQVSDCELHKLSIVTFLVCRFLVEILTFLSDGIKPDIPQS